MNLERNLDDARIAGRKDAADLRRLIDVGVRGAEARMVEEVEEIAAELEVAHVAEAEVAGLALR